MIKIEYEEREGTLRLSLTSNNDDTDLLDTIGNAIMSTNPKRGAYLGDTMVIDIKKDD